MTMQPGPKQKFSMSLTTIIVFALIVIGLVFYFSRRTQQSKPKLIAEIKAGSSKTAAELTARGENELYVRVVNATTQIVQLLEQGDVAGARKVADEVNAQLVTLKVTPLAPALRVDASDSRPKQD
jgi:hypothetical protein